MKEWILNNFSLQKFLSDSKFKKEIIKNSKLVIINFVADWSGNCHITAPIFDKIVATYKDRIKFIKLDIDANRQVIKEYDNAELPILLFYKEGEVQEAIFGTFSKYELELKIETLLQ